MLHVLVNRFIIAFLCSMSMIFSVYAMDSMNPTGDVVGGGEGYTRSADLSVAELTHRVSTTEELVIAMALAKPGEVVYVEDGVELDLSGRVLMIPENVTLAGGRGYNGSEGALLFTTEQKTLPLIRAGGKNVRVTGLRVKGPDENRRTEEMKLLWEEGKYYTTPVSRGISSAYANLEIDNCELWGWTHAAIHLIGASSQAYIHHNFIHHNQRWGLGYGIVLDEAKALIEANLFDWNRHSIAGTGKPETSYEARYNVVLENASSHAFDMHGGTDRNDNTNIAGDEINIHHNDFLLSADVIDVYGAIVIRGLPRTGASIHHNKFRNLHNLKKAVWQKNEVGMMRVYENEYPSCS